jgi:hypothetical protein
MRILKYGSCELYSFTPKEIDVTDVISMKKIEVYTNVKSLYQNVNVTVSEIYMGKFTLTSNNTCTVNWIVVESSEIDMLSYMQLYPIF